MLLVCVFVMKNESMKNYLCCRQPFLSPRRQSSVRTQNITDSVVMEPLTHSTPPTEQQQQQQQQQQTDVEEETKSDGETEGRAESEKSGESEQSEVGGASEGMERSLAPTMSDTDAESERDTGTVATAISLSDESVPMETRERGTSEIMADRTEGGCEDSEGGEGVCEGVKVIVDRQTSTDTQSRTLSHRHDNDDLTASNNQSDGIDRVSATSTDDLMAIISGEPPSDDRPHPHTASQCSVMSLDALLGDTAYFLHFRVISNSGQRYVCVYIQWPIWTPMG